MFQDRGGGQDKERRDFLGSYAVACWIFVIGGSVVDDGFTEQIMDQDARSFVYMERKAIVCKDAVTNKVCGDGRRSPGESHQLRRTSSTSLNKLTIHGFLIDCPQEWAGSEQTLH